MSSRPAHGPSRPLKLRRHFDSEGATSVRDSNPLQSDIASLFFRIVSAFSTRVLVLFLTFGASVVAARALGPEDRGHLAVMIAVPSFLSTFGTIGLEASNLYFAGQSSRAYSMVSRWSLLHGTIMGSFLAAGFILVGSLLPSAMFGLSESEFLLSSSVAPIVLLGILLGNAEVGRGRLLLYNVAVASSVAIYCGTLLLLSAIGEKSVSSFFLGFVISQMTTTGVLVVVAQPWKRGAGEAPTVAAMFSYGLRSYSLGTLQFLLLRVDTLLIQIFAGSVAVGIYSVAYPMAEALIMISVAVNLVLLPRIARASMHRKSVLKVAAVTFMASVGCSAVISIVAPHLIPRLFGTEFKDAVVLLWILLPGVTLLNFARVLQTYFSGEKRFAPSIACSSAALVVLILLSMKLVPNHGAEGAAIAAAISYLVFAAAMTILFFIGASTNWRLKRTNSNISMGEGLGSAPNYRAGIGNFGRQGGAKHGLVVNRVQFLVVLLAVSSALFAGVSVARQPLPILFSAALVIFSIIMLRPMVGVILLAALSPASVILGDFLPSTYLLIPVTLLATLGGYLFRRGLLGFRTWWVFPVTGFYLIASWMVGIALHPSGESFAKSFFLVCALTAPLFLVPLCPMEGRGMRWALNTLTVSISLTAAWYLFYARALLRESSNRASDWISISNGSENTNHNLLGALLILGVALILPRLMQNRSMIVQFLIVLALGVLVMAALYSFSRSTYAAIPLMFVVFLVIRGIRWLAIGTMALAIGLQLLPVAVYDRITYTVSGNGGSLDPSSAVRLDLWQAAFEMFKHFPLFGVGLYQFGRLLPTYWSQTSTSHVSDVDFSALIFAHNTILSIASQLGLVGLLLFAGIGWTMWSNIKTTLRSNCSADRSESALLAMVGLGTASLFGEPLFSLPILVPFIFVVAASYRWPIQEVQ